MIRLIVDPNSTSRVYPDYTPVLMQEIDDEIPTVGEAVLAVQPGEDGTAYVGDAIVAVIDEENELIYLDVDWKSFRTEDED